jgi:superfamily II DNA or RNA helicase
MELDNTQGDGVQTFGYYPDPSRLDIALRRGSFARAVVVATPVGVLAGKVGACRITWTTDAELPEGVYWFEGVADGAIVLQVEGGAPPGGATVVPLEDLEDGHPLAVAWGWAEELWADADPVPVPRFDIGESAVTHPGGIDVVVRDRKFLTQQWSYILDIQGGRQEVAESRLRPRPPVDDPSTWVTGEPTPAARFGATLTRAKLQGKFTNTLFSFRATRTTFRPYQFKPVLKLLQTGKARLLIADEVGLGKTIEAGLIWTELEARQEADRVLVVCPSGLVGKWMEEMEDRFGFELTELDTQRLDDFRDKHLQGRLPPRQAYICSLERLRKWDGLDKLRDLPPEFDLVIVDEAHSMRNQDTRSYALGAELSEWAGSLVFLTATPINLHQQDLLNLLELLAPEDYGSLQDLELRLEPNKIINAVTARLMEPGVSGRALNAQLRGLGTTALGPALMRRPDFALLTDLLAKDELAASDIVEAKRYLSDLNALATVITRTRKVEVDDRKGKRIEDRQEIHWAQAEEDFYAEYLQWCVDRAKASGSSTYFAMQMPLRLASACLPMARRAVLDPESFGRLSDADSDASADRLEPHPELVEAALRLPESVDTKFDALNEVMHELHRQGRRALVFTHSRPALAYLAERVRQDFRVAVMHGGVSREDRRRIMADFRAGAYDFVFANRVASEGLDFEFCSAVVNYDLPWNPMEIEQRIGRIDRIGQQEEVMLVVNFVNESTIDERILTRLLDRIEIFESSIGALEPIISAGASTVLKAGFDFTLTEAQREQKVREALAALEEQRVGLRELSDAASALLVSNDVDVAGLERDLVRTGRYIGQRELALLLDDWAQVDDAPGVRFAKDGLTMDLNGNPAMAARVQQLATSARRTRAETSALAIQLRGEMPIHLVLDQERARTGGGTLLTATSPLVMAAVLVPGHRHARFASLRLAAHAQDAAPGVYVVVLAKAAGASRGGDEIWGAAVTDNGRITDDRPANLLLRALAEGHLADAPLPPVERLTVFAEKALNQLRLRHTKEQFRRDNEFQALQESRRITLGDQHRRKLEAIETRLSTARARGRDPRSIALFQGQRRRAEERFASLMSELASATQPEIRLEPLAACVIEVVSA